MKNFQWSITPKKGGEANVLVKVIQGHNLLTWPGDREKYISIFLTSPQDSHFPRIFSPTEASEQPKGEAREGSSGTRKGDSGGLATSV